MKWNSDMFKTACTFLFAAQASMNNVLVDGFIPVFGHDLFHYWHSMGNVLKLVFIRSFSLNSSTVWPWRSIGNGHRLYSNISKYTSFKRIWYKNKTKKYFIYKLFYIFQSIFLWKKYFKNVYSYFYNNVSAYSLLQKCTVGQDSNKHTHKHMTLYCVRS